MRFFSDEIAFLRRIPFFEELETLENMPMRYTQSAPVKCNTPNLCSPIAQLAKSRKNNIARMILTVAVALSITGCGGVGSLLPGAAIHGSLQSGVGVSQHMAVKLYAASTVGNASPSEELSIGSVAVRPDGTFTVPATYSCPSSSAQLYVVARGTSSKLPDSVKEGGLALMAALGSCGDLNAAQPIVLDEQTTAASVVALAPYMVSSLGLGADPADTPSLAAAFLSAKTSTVTVEDDHQKLSTTIVGAQTNTIRTLAALIRDCSSSQTGVPSACQAFFSDAATKGQSQPTDTITAALAIVRKPAVPNVLSVSLSTEATTSQSAPAVVGQAGSTIGLPKIAQNPNPARAIPSGSSFTPPNPNACNSAYDRYYMAEPGVYTYWALCETGSNPSIYDYVGRYDLTWASGAWSSPNGTIQGGVSGPVSDGESADQVSTASSYVASMNMPLNGRQGTLAVWAKTDSTNYPMSMIFLGAVNGGSAITLSAVTPNSQECFVGSLANSSGTAFNTSQACGYVANTWHRVVFTWQNGTLALFVDGVQLGGGTYSGALDNKVFVYRLFPQSGNTGKQMTLAKALIANQAWTAAQVASDFKPNLPTPPTGGILVTDQLLGTIHKDVLGYADINSDISKPQTTSALTSGLIQAGIHSIRYANGYTGITADLENWQGGASCTSQLGVTAPATNVATNNTLDTFMPKVANAVGASLGYTVNYGTNPPFCNAGGDPIVNGASLVDYANNQKHYGIKYWEIGNELYNGGGSETDFHPQPGNGLSYATYESQFYKSMKAKDSTIKIGIPVADGVYSWAADWTLPALANADYDAAVFHNYPLQEGITDGSTLYGDRVTSNIARVRGSLLALQTELLNAGKSPEAIWVTEWNGDAQASGTNAWSRQTLGAAMPMFAAMQLAEYMQAGVQYASWFGQGTPAACWPWNYDWTGESSYSWTDFCGSPFLTYTGSVPYEVEVGFKPGDLTPTARGFQVLSESDFVTEGEHMLRVVTDPNVPWLASYAATHGSSYAVLLINRDQTQTHSVPIQLAGQTRGATVTQWSYGRQQYDLTQAGNWSAAPSVSPLTAWSKSFTATLPPWSVSVLIFKR